MKKVIISIRRATIDVDSIPKIQINIGPESLTLDKNGLVSSDESAEDAENLFDCLLNNLPSITYKRLLSKFLKKEKEEFMRIAGYDV